MKSALYLSIAIILLLVISVLGSPAVTINAQQATQTPTSEATSESTVEATASVTAEATSQATSEATAQATANPTSAAATPAPQATAEATADQDGMTMNAPSLDSAESIAFLWFAHTSPDAGPVDIYVQELGNSPLLTNMAFGQVSPMIVVPSGSKTITARPAGSSNEADDLFTLTTDVGSGTSWLISVVGRQANRSVTLETTTMLRDATNGSARIRVINYLPQVSSVTVSSESGEDFGQNLGWIGIKDLDVQPNTYTLSVSSAEGTLIEPESFTFDQDTFNLVLLIGSTAGDNQPRFLVINAPQHTTRVRFISNRPGAVDIHMKPGDQLVASSVEHGQTTDYVEVPSGSATFTAFEVGTGPDGTQLASLAGQLLPGYDLTIVLGDDNTMVLAESVISPTLMVTE